MLSDATSAQKVAELRAFAGDGVPDARLRAALVRAGGDLNAAASALLERGALGCDQPILVTRQSQTPSARPESPTPPTRAPPTRAEQRVVKLSTQEIRRLAWRRFYQEKYDGAVATVGLEKAAINAHITGLWKSAGSSKRAEYTSAVRAQFEHAIVASGEQDRPIGSEGPLQNAAESRAMEAKASESSPVTPAKANTPSHLPSREERDEHEGGNKQPKRVATDEPTNSSTFADPPPAKRIRRGSNVQSADLPHAEAPQDMEFKFSDTAAPAWPKRIASRPCRGIMLVTGKKKLLANDNVTLEVPPATRTGKGPGRGKTKTQGPVRIVRFSKNGREVGRLADDVATVLAPALQSGFIHTTCRVIDAPTLSKMFAEVLLDVSVFLKKEAFEQQNEQQATEGGVSSSAKEADVAPVEDGVDARRINVVNLITSLNLCEPPEKDDDDFPLARGNENGDAGAVSEENAEAYYRTVTDIDKRDANSFTPPMNLACTLREYQLAGVGWMVSREKYGSLGKAQDSSAIDVMLNPLWKRRVFPDGTDFFLNSTTGGLSIEAPIANKGGTFGGILADEMGLGKTVQCIACIVHDIEQERAGGDRSHLGHSEPERPISPSGEDAENGINDVTCRKNENVDTTNGDVDTKGKEREEASATPHVAPGKEDGLSKSPRRTETNQAQDQGTEVVPFSRPRHRLRRRTETYDYSEENNHSADESASEESDEEWQDDARNNLAPRPPPEATENDDDWFESPGKWKKQNPKGVRKEGSALKKLMAAAHSGRHDAGGTLIVCPTSLVTQWMNELHDHVAPNFLRAATHYGQSRGDASSISLRFADVVVTTYGILSSEAPDGSTEGDSNRMSDTADGGPIFRLPWRRVILDEAHTIKSRSTKWARAAFRIRAEKRWCVTGTVIHNHVNDVFSLLRFLQVKPWSSWAFWNRGIVSNIDSKDQASQKLAMSLLRDIISSMTLRRKKSTKDSQGRPIVHLPKKTVEIVCLTPSLEEQDFYSALHARSKVQFDAFVRQGKVMKNFACVLELLLRLRQACDHPYLVFAAAPSKDSVLMKDKDKLFKQFLDAGSSSQYVENVLNAAESGALQKSAECPICLDAIDDPVAPKECGHPACRACLLEALQRSRKCPVCRVTITSNSITTLPRATRFSVDLQKRWRSSAKIDALLHDVKDIHSKRMQNGGQAIGKTVVFSQFTSMLDLVGIALDREKLKSLRIDGSVPQAQRAQILERFEKEDELSSGTANILLVSLRAGGVGLNLVAAAHALLLDIHWNPQVDAQAQDRVHRHGQTRDVIIKRYIVKDSVEERLLEVQDRKQDIADGALGVATDEDKKQARLSELKLLFSA